MRWAGSQFATRIATGDVSSPGTNQARNRLNSQTRTVPSENIALTRMPLKRQQDLVSLRRETRAAAEQCGLDDRSVRSLSAASYEAARLLFGETQDARAEISLTPSGELQVGIQIDAVAPAERQSVGRSVSALASGLHRISVEDSADSLIVTLTARVRCRERRTLRVQPEVEGEPEGSELVVPELVEENVKLRRALIELQDELTETNRGVVALYAALDNQTERLRQAEHSLRSRADELAAANRAKEDF